MSILHIDSVIKYFGDKVILQGVYLKCETGKVTGILGRNGTGKSTLLQIIFGTVKADNYFIRYNNLILKSQYSRQGRVSYLPQQNFLPGNIKIEQLISLFCNEEAQDQLTRSTLVAPFLKETLQNLSKGEQRVIEILLILYSTAEFILLDEPFHSLSPKIAEEIKKSIRKVASKKGLIISDHNYQSVMDISDEVQLLSNGNLKQINNIKDLESYNYLSKSI